MGDPGCDAAGHHAKVGVRQRPEQVEAGLERDRVCPGGEQIAVAFGHVAVPRRVQTVELDAVSDVNSTTLGSRTSRLTCNALLFTRLLLAGLRSRR